MRVTTLQLENYRAFEGMDPIELGSINVLIGKNNAGKSSVVRALYCMQSGGDDAQIGSNIRSGKPFAKIRVGLAELLPGSAWAAHGGSGPAKLLMTLDGASPVALALMPDDASSMQGANVPPYPGSEPNHFIVPFLSRRRPLQYDERTRKEETVAVTTTKTNLAAKLARISNPTFPGNAEYSDACREILGFEVGVVDSINGQLPGRYLLDRSSLAIGQLGDGVQQIASFLVDIVGSEGKLFLIEEPENDLHPAALKALLGLIVTSSASNQFVISTHSGIVLQYLGADSACRIFQVASSSGKENHAATITRLADTPDARIEVLRDLGYALSDFALWEGWLILEESTAERIIASYLIPWFVPELRGVRTVAAGGVDNVTPTLEAFNRLFRFAHLENVYAGRAWVCVDGDDAGTRVIAAMKNGYAKGWPPDHFRCFSQEDFEHYYPSMFAEQVKSVLGDKNQETRRSRKRGLFNEVVRWLDADEDRAKEALQRSARDVIGVLRDIASQLSGATPPVDQSTLR